MAKKRKIKKAMPVDNNTYIENAGIVVDQGVTDTLVKNYMPYAMSVIVSRAIPEIDGFKPSHRKILYTMYKMGLLGGSRVKSANAVGEVMKLHPHGDQAIYETMVRLAKGNEALLHPFIDSKGNFGKCYSRDMAFAASRYTEMKLMPICNELFGDIDKDTVDMVDNYDGTRKEPALLPVSFPSILVNSNVGIAVGMASAICSFNLTEICNTTIELIRNPEHNIIDTLPAPDFSLGGKLIYNIDEMKKIYETGRGSFKVRGSYNYDKGSNCIEITSIPPTTTVEAIIDKVVEFVKNGKMREISDIRDETDLNGLKIAVDLKRSADPQRVAAKLFKFTSLEDSFSCNFNILVGSVPQVLGVKKILNEWVAYRFKCVKRRICFELNKKREKLHLLLGLKQILLDIDKAIKTVRETAEEQEVVPNLMIEFGIDQIQAEFVAEIKLRHLNREYILKKTNETDQIEKDIKELTDILKNDKKVNSIIIKELKEIAKKYGQPRKTEIVTFSEDEILLEDDPIENYPVNLFFTNEGYFKKITPQSYRMSNDQKLKEGDFVTTEILTKNRSQLLFFSDKGTVYKAAVSDFDDTKASVLGDYIPAKLGFKDDENAISMVVTDDFEGYVLFAFQNGKVAKIELSSYVTKTKRKKLLNAYCLKETLVGIISIPTDKTIMLTASNGRILLLDTARLTAKSVRDSRGVQVMNVRGKHVVVKLKEYKDDIAKNAHRYVPKTIPSSGYMPKEADIMEQLTL